MSQIHSQKKDSMSGFMKRLGTNFLPDKAIVTSCEVRSKVLQNLLILFAFGVAAIVIPLVIILVAASTVHDITVQSSDWWHAPAFLLLLGWPLIFKKSRPMKWFFTFMEDGVDIREINIPGVVIVITVVIIILNVCLYLFVKVPMLKTMPFFYSLIGVPAVFGWTTDMVLAGGLVFMVGFLILKAVYEVTIGKETKITYTTTDEVVKVASYPWYKAQAIKWSLCKIYEPD